MPLGSAQAASHKGNGPTPVFPPLFVLSIWYLERGLTERGLKQEKTILLAQLIATDDMDLILFWKNKTIQAEIVTLYGSEFHNLCVVWSTTHNILGVIALHEFKFF